MKQLYIALLGISFMQMTKGMEAPKLPALTIVGERTGSIDTSCQTTADLLRNGASLAHIVYTLGGAKRMRPAICTTGPIAYQNNTFLACIQSLTITAPVSSSWTLLAFAIKNLQELHEKQDKTNIKNHTLYIDAIVNPESYESTIFEFFGFKKVGNFFAAGKEQHLYLLDENQELITSRYQPYIPASLSVTITENPVLKLEPTEEEKYWQKFFDSKNKETEAFYNQTPSTDIQKINPSELQTPIPAVAAPMVTAAYPRLIRSAPTEPSSESSSDEMHAVKTSDTLTPRNAKLSALAKLRTKSGKPQKLSRTELEAMQSKTGLFPIRGISKKKDR